MQQKAGKRFFFFLVFTYGSRQMVCPTMAEIEARPALSLFKKLVFSFLIYQITKCSPEIVLKTLTIYISTSTIYHFYSAVLGARSFPVVHMASINKTRKKLRLI